MMFSCCHPRLPEEAQIALILQILCGFSVDADRLPAVQRALYLLFNEGYHGASAETALRAELCREAIRLTTQMIISLYDKLMAIRPSPIVALNRAIAVAQRDGPLRGLEEIRAIDNFDRLAGYPFYHAALGEFALRSRRHELACEHFRTALKFARNSMERKFLEQRVAACGSGRTATAT